MRKGYFFCMAITAPFLTIICASLIAGSRDSDASFTSRMNKINKHLDMALDRVLDVHINYTTFRENATYLSSTNFNPRGMAGLYNITNIFMDALVKEAYPRGFLKAEEGSIKIQSFQENWDTLLKHYSGLLAVIITFLIFGVLTPIVGFFFCCCRCCGNCGARSQPFDKKHDSCRKVILATLLICAGTGMLFGVVCAFVSNQHLQDGTNELTTNLHRSVDDGVAYLEHTNKHIDMLLITNYGELENTLFSILKSSSEIVFDQLGEYSKAVSLTTLTKMVKGLPEVQSNLVELTAITNGLRVNASQLNDDLRRVKRDLLKALKECQTCNLDNVVQDISKMNTQVDFDKLPDVTSELEDLRKFIVDKDIAAQVEKGQQRFADLKTQMAKAVKDVIPKITDAIDDAGKAIQGGASNLTRVLKSTTEMIRNNTRKPLENADRYIKEYSPYRYYIGLGVSVILLLIAMCVSFGLMCGVCGKRPDGYGDDCCNKGAGSRFLMIGVAIMFLFTIVLVVIALASFATGLVAQRLVCDPLRSPADNQLLELTDRFLNLQRRLGVTVNISTILESCYQNKSIYEVLHLETKMNMSEVENYFEEYKISDEIDKLKNKIMNISVDVTILEDDTKQVLKDLASSSLSQTQWGIFIEVLQDNITSIDLNLLADKLENVSGLITSQRNTDLQKIRNALKVNARHLRTYQARLVNPMLENGQHMRTIATNLEEGLKFNESSFPDAVNKLISEVEEAQQYLKINGTQILARILTDFASSNENLVREYLRLVKDNVENDVGQCGPVSLILNATLTSTCDKILLPWNGFWFGVGWCLILFIPTIILSVKLATLYQKSDPYPGPLVESHDKYGKKKKKKQQKRSAHDNRGGYMAGNNGPERMTPREIAGASSHADARYADMAPKHWEEFPAGGPPQYQPGAPPATEYERPPPYYYPGPGEQH